MPKQIVELFRNYTAGTDVTTTETLGSIINEIDALYPNTLSDTIKTGWINAELQSLFRNVNCIYSFVTVEDQAVYELPTYVEVENITSGIFITTEDTTIDSESAFREYSYTKQSDGYLTGNKYYRVDYSGLNNIGIYPVPDTDDLIAMFTYKKKPAALSADTQTAKPDIQADWVDILKWKCIMLAALAGNNPDIEIYNAYMQLYNAKLFDIMGNRYKKEQSFPQTKDVTKRGNYSRRLRSQSHSDLTESLSNTLEIL